MNPSGNPMMHDPAELAKFHKMVTDWDKRRPSLVPTLIGAPLDGALMGALIGWAVHRKEGGHGHVGKHALYGAAIGGALGLLGVALGKSLSVGMHLVEEEEQRNSQAHAQFAASGWWDRLWGGWGHEGWGHEGWGHHHGHHHHGWGHEGWGYEQPRLWGRQHPQHHHQSWREEVLLPQPSVTYGPASAEDQAAVYSHGGLQ